MKDIWLEVAEQIKSLYPNREFVPLHEPTFSGREIKYVTDCIASGWVSSVGKYVDAFERSLADYTGVKRAVAVVNGTAALHMALKIAGVRPNDEVFVPSLTFVATANAVTYCGATPHFVDVSHKTLGLDAHKLEDYLTDIAIVKNNVCVNKYSGKTIRAVIAMHTFGHPVDLDPLLEVCRRFRLVLVEDAAEALGSFYKGLHAGNFGKASAVSFNGNKMITTGGGGAILTNDHKLADYAKHLTTTAKVPHPWQYDHDEIGYNYRMPNMNAALGCAQLEHVKEFLGHKRRLTEKYAQIFSRYQGVEVFREPSFAQSNYWLQTLIIDDKKYDPEVAVEMLNHNGVMARPVWRPLHRLKPYEHCPKSDVSVADELSARMVNLPSSPDLGESIW